METLAQKYIDHTLSTLKGHALEDKELAEALDNLLRIVEAPINRKNYEYNDDKFSTSLFVEDMKKLRLINFITKKDYSEPLGDVTK
jgi:hypothetical protein